VQLYTGMVYAGPALPGQILKGLSQFLDKEGLRSLSDIRDTQLAHWAGKPL
jgi:dihydroorotate dehydrogenase